MPYNFVADSFYTKRNFVADFFEAKSDFSSKTAVLRFEPTLWGGLGGLGATYDVHLRLIGKRVVDFLLVSIELFIGATAEALGTNVD